MSKLVKDRAAARTVCRLESTVTADLSVFKFVIAIPEYAAVAIVRG